MNFLWNQDKNHILKTERDVCFEDVVTLINEGDILDIIKHPNQKKYPEQKIYVVLLHGYVHMVPFVRDSNEIFLKTIVPSRKMHKLYKGDRDEV
ncbi:MAG: toxin [Arcobacter sp.]|nr:MAG: toxin [Arcobacter sp.]